jgi:hypothetical protein
MTQCLKKLMYLFGKQYRQEPLSVGKHIQVVWLAEEIEDYEKAWQMQREITIISMEWNNGL